jgi:hypothetical protein
MTHEIRAAEKIAPHASEALPQATATGTTAAPARKYSYSHKRLNAFDLWQEHVRKSAQDMGRALFEAPDRIA